MAQTLKPSGLTIERNGTTFVLSWKVSDIDYNGGIQVQYQSNLSGKKWYNGNVIIGDTTCSITINLKNYYPNTASILTAINFRVRGKRDDVVDENPDEKKWYDWETSEWEYYGYNNQYSRIRTWYKWSDWAEKSFTILAPDKPILSEELDSELENATNFSWSLDVQDNDSKPFVRTQYESILVLNSDVTDATKLAWKSTTRGWRTGTGSSDTVYINANSSSPYLTIYEDTDLTVNNSYTRWVRVRSQGPGGASGWRYIKHVYARPHKPVINAKNTWIASAAQNTSAVTTGVRVSWSVLANPSHPIDKVEAQYLIDTPETGLICPDGGSWSTAVTIGDTSDTDTVFFNVDDQLDLDQCLWVRIVSWHDEHWTPSEPYLMKKGELKPPTEISNLQVDFSGQRAEMRVENESDVPDSKIAIVFRKEGQKDIVCGIITSSDPKIVYCSFTDASKISFGAYAFQGTYSVAKKISDSQPTHYTVKANMESATIWSGGEVPLPPGNVTVKVQREGEVLVDWAWSWVQAMQAEVSWSQNQYAWDSTEGPQTYMVDNMHSSDIRISDLELGVTWYFRVRLAKETDGNLVYGPYCNTVSVNLATAPLKPVLMLSRSIVTPKQTLTASWTYESTDGKSQNYAEVYVVNSAGTTRIKLAAKTNTSKSVTIPSGLATNGNTYYLSVRVRSSAGMTSEWSDPVAVHVANPPTCTISSTTLKNADEYSLYGTINRCYDSEDDSVTIPYTYSDDSDYADHGYSYIISDSGIMEFEPLPLVYELLFGVDVPDPEVPSLVFQTKSEAEAFIETLNGYFEDLYEEADQQHVWKSYYTISVAYIKSLLSVSSTAIDEITGWTDSELYADYKDAYISRVNGGYKVILPKPIFIAYVLNPTSYEGAAEDQQVATLVPVYVDYVKNGAVIKTTQVDVWGRPLNTNTNVRIRTTPVGLNAYWLARSDSIVVRARLFAGSRFFVWANQETFYKSTNDLYLRNMPMSVTVTGAGKGGITTLAIERAESYHVDRPDESVFNGFEGETIFSVSQTGEKKITISNDMLIGSLDDGAKYRLIATVQDGLGQIAKAIKTFTVRWYHQALTPQATAEINEDRLVAYITPIAPIGADNADTCDIYRLSADKPNLIVKDAEFGTKYVDPYPASGIFSGHRVVYKTYNGDYIKESSELAWIDLGFDENDYLELIETIIDFDGDRVRLMYNMNLDNSWQKEFEETKYLGGSVQGDWNPGVSRSGSVSGMVVTPKDQNTVRALRRLAVYPGICHVRTPEGSSFSADVQVKESRDLAQGSGIVRFDLSFTRVDSEGLDGMTYEQWVTEGA